MSYFTSGVWWAWTERYLVYMIALPIKKSVWQQGKVMKIFKLLENFIKFQKHFFFLLILSCTPAASPIGGRANCHLLLAIHWLWIRTSYDPTSNNSNYPFNWVCRKLKFWAYNSYMFIIELFKQENVHIFIFLAVLWYFIYASPIGGCSCIDQLCRFDWLYIVHPR